MIVFRVLLLICCIALILELISMRKKIKVMDMELRVMHDDYINLQMDFDSLSRFSLKLIQDKHSDE